MFDLHSGHDPVLQPGFVVAFDAARRTGVDYDELGMLVESPTDLRVLLGAVLAPPATSPNTIRLSPIMSTGDRQWWRCRRSTGLHQLSWGPGGGHWVHVFPCCAWHHQDAGHGRKGVVLSKRTQVSPGHVGQYRDRCGERKGNGAQSWDVINNKQNTMQKSMTCYFCCGIVMKQRQKILWC